MEVQKVKLVYFSPTGTTQKVLESIARGIGVEAVGARQSDASARRSAVSCAFFGRTRNHRRAGLWRSAAGGALHRGALLCDRGKFPSPTAVRTATTLIRRWLSARTIKDKIKSLQPDGARGDLEIPGRFPYEGGARAMTAAPVTREDICTVCGTCATVVPDRGRFGGRERGDPGRALHPLLCLYQELSHRRAGVGRRDDETDRRVAERKLQRSQRASAFRSGFLIDTEASHDRIEPPPSHPSGDALGVGGGSLSGSTNGAG